MVNIESGPSLAKALPTFHVDPAGFCKNCCAVGHAVQVATFHYQLCFWTLHRNASKT